MFPVFYQKLDWVHSHCRCWCSSLLCQIERVNGSSGFEIVKCLPSTHTIHRLNNKMKMSHPCHTSFKERFSENFDLKAVTHLIYFVGMLWFQKWNFWKNPLSPFWGRRGRWGQMTSKLKTVKILNENSSKIDEIQILASATSKMASATSRISEGAQWIFPKNTFFKSGQSTEKNEL